MIEYRLSRPYNGRTDGTDVCLGDFYGAEDRPEITVVGWSPGYKFGIEKAGYWNSILRMVGFKGLPRNGKQAHVTIPSMEEGGYWGHCQLPYQLYRQIGERFGDNQIAIDILERWFKTIRYNRNVNRDELLHLMMVEIGMNVGHGVTGFTDYYRCVYKYSPRVVDTIRHQWNHRKLPTYAEELVNNYKGHCHPGYDSEPCLGGHLLSRVGTPMTSRIAVATKYGVRPSRYYHLVGNKDVLKKAGFSDDALALVELWYKRYDVPQISSQ